MKFVSLTIAATLLAGCATFNQGSSQGITLTSNAADAMCSISQNGVEVVPPQPVPATHMIGKRAGNLVVNCTAPEYEPATVALVTGKHPMAVTGMMLTGIFNVGADAVTSSWHEYQNEAYIHLKRKSVL